MGLLTLQLARRGGAARIIVSEPHDGRRALAQKLGAHQVVNPRATPVAEAIADFTRGRGVDAAFECAGHPTALATCLDAVVRQGTVVMVGVNAASARLELDLYQFHFRFITLIGSYGGGRQSDWHAAAQWIGELDLAPLISHRYDLADIATAFDVARVGQGMKVLVGPGLA